MRAAGICLMIASANLALATPTLAQSFPQRMDDNLRASELRAQQDIANQQSVILQNQLNMLDVQMRTERALANVQAQGQAPRVPPIAYPENQPLDTGLYVSIPDAALAASNARIKAVTETRR